MQFDNIHDLLIGGCQFFVVDIWYIAIFKNRFTKKYTIVHVIGMNYCEFGIMEEIQSITLKGIHKNIIIAQ